MDRFHPEKVTKRKKEHREISLEQRRLKDIDRKKRIESNGPDYLTGEGMGSEDFLKKLNSSERMKRSKPVRFWDGTFGTGLNKGALVRKYEKQVLDRINELLRSLDKRGESIVMDTIVGEIVQPREVIRGDLDKLAGNITLASALSIGGKTLAQRRMASDFLAAEGDCVERLGWALNPKTAPSKHRGTLSEAYKLFEGSNSNSGEEGNINTINTFHQRAFVTIHEATRYERNKIRELLELNKKEVSPEYKELDDSYLKLSDFFYKAATGEYSSDYLTKNAFDRKILEYIQVSRKICTFREEILASSQSQASDSGVDEITEDPQPMSEEWNKAFLS